MTLRSEKAIRFKPLDALVLAAIAGGASDHESIRAWADWVDHQVLSPREIAGAVRRLEEAELVVRAGPSLSLAERTLRDLVRNRRPAALLALATALCRK